MGFAVAVGIAIGQGVVKCIELVRGACRPPAPRPPAPRPPAPRSTALGASAQRAVLDPATISYYGHEAVTQALRPIWLARRPYDFNEAELAAWSELAAAFDEDFEEDRKQQDWS
jgi:hypothetical protein